MNSSKVKKKTKKMLSRQSRRYAENPRDTAVLRGQRPSGSIFRKKQKNTFLDMVQRSVCIKFQVCKVFRLARMSRTNHQTHIQGGKRPQTPVHNLNYKHVRKSTHVALKYHQCRTPVPNFINPSYYLIPENGYSNGRV